MRNQYKSLILDMDGVLFRGDQPIGNLSNIFADISRKGVQVVLATNNSTRTPEDYLKKMAKHGVLLEAWQVINSAEATAEYLLSINPRNNKVFIIGESGLVEAVKKRGFSLVTNYDNPFAVVVGLDRDIDYKKLEMGSYYIQRGSRFIGTNPDVTIPTPEGLAPGAGTIIQALEVASGVSAEIIGKPKPIIFQLAISRLGSSPASTLVVGDRLETDILGGLNAGCKTALVLSGVTTPNLLKKSKIKPDFVAENLDEIVSEWL